MHGLLIDRSVASVAASLATAAVVSILFQQTAPFKSQTDLVRLNVVVLDNRTGKPVLDLAAADFTVTEDGRDQKIVHFLAAGNPVERSTSVSADQRAFLFVFGSGYLDGPIRPYDGVTTFIRQELRPGDRVGLLAWNRVTDLTSSHEEVADAVQRLRTMPDNLLTSWLRDQQRLDDLSPQTQAGIDRLFSVAGELPLRSAPALLVGTQEFKQNAPLWGRWNRQFIGWDKLKVIAGIEHLRRLQGEKHLVYVSRAGLSLPIRFVNEGIGLRVESTDDDLRLAVRAAEANVTLHVIHTIGTDQRTGVAFHSSQNLAYLTGGQFTSARSAIEQLKRINEASQSSYVLGYISAKSPDDKYRRV
jgi:VWFA-related protein